MADYTYDGGYHSPVSNRAAPKRGGNAASMTNVAGAAASLALVVGVGVWSYGVLARDVSGVPVVQAATGPMRVAPEDPGGTLADHQGLSVNTVAGLGAAEGPAEQLLLAPVPSGLAAEDVATGAMLPAEETRATPTMAASLAQSGGNTLPQAGLDSADQILALAAQIAAESEPLLPLTPLEEGEAAPVVTSVQDASSSAALPEDDTAEEQASMAFTGPGLRQSLRPRTRPSGLQIASLGPVDAATVAAAVASVTQEIDASTLPAGTRLVQIGAFDSPETARSEWKRLETRFGEFLDGKGRVIQQAQSGGRTFFRLRAEGFEDLADARRFCAAFVAEKVDCIPVVTK